MAKPCWNDACDRLVFTTGRRKFCVKCKEQRARDSRRAYESRRPTRPVGQRLDPKIEAQLAQLAAARKAKRAASWSSRVDPLG